MTHLMLKTEEMKQELFCAIQKKTREDAIYFGMGNQDPVGIFISQKISMIVCIIYTTTLARLCDVRPFLKIRSENLY